MRFARELKASVPKLVIRILGRVGCPIRPCVKFNPQTFIMVRLDDEPYRILNFRFLGVWLERLSEASWANGRVRPLSL